MPTHTTARRPRPHRPRARAGALGVLLLVAAGALAVPSVPAANAGTGPDSRTGPDPEKRGAPAGLAAFYGQEPDWAACDFDAAVDCASIEVPMDYADPGGRRITLAVSRQRASDPAHRRGALLSNPGGPGGSGLVEPGPEGEEQSWPKRRFAGTPLAERYDLIGFDPRGVGRSTPLSCETTDVEKPIVSRPTEADVTAHAAWAKAAEKACEKGGGALRKFVNTRNTARDMDVLRGVLGERKVSYVGYSYGTYLGAFYGSMFADHLDRSVLDSSLDPGATWRETDMAGSVADRRNVEAWAEWTARRDGRYALGTSRAEVLAAVEAASAALPDTPPDGDEGGRGDRTRFDQELGYSAQLRADWPALAETVREVRETGGFPQPEPPGKRAVGGRTAAGTGTVTGYLPVNQTIHCETDWPADLDTYRRDVAHFQARYPYGSGAGTAMPDPCTYRSFTPPEKPTEIRRDGYPTGLVVQAEGDAQTPYAGGVAMAARLDSRLVTVADDGHHGQYARRGNTCVDTAVTAYLLDGELPDARGLTCPGQPRPDIPEDGGR